MVSIIIEHKLDQLFALVKVIDGNTTREYWIPEFLIPQFKAEAKGSLKTQLADTSTDNSIGDLDA